MLDRNGLMRAAFTLAILLAAAGCYAPDEEAAAPPSIEAVAGLPYYVEETFRPYWYEADALPDGLHAIPPFTVIDQRGHVVTESDFEGKIYIANFFFTECAGICPTTMANLVHLQAEFDGDADVAILSHSVTPETDSVARLRDFADELGATAPGWFLVTGDREEVYDLGRNAYFADEDLGVVPADGDERDRFLHTESFFLIDQHRHIRGIYNGMNRTAVSQLIEDVRTLQKEGVGAQ